MVLTSLYYLLIYLVNVDSVCSFLEINEIFLLLLRSSRLFLLLLQLLLGLRLEVPLFLHQLFSLLSLLLFLLQLGNVLSVSINLNDDIHLIIDFIVELASGWVV